MNCFFRVVGIATVCSFICVNGTLAQQAIDKITIISVEPSGPVLPDRPAKFTVIAEVTVGSLAEGVVELGFNSETAVRSEMNHAQNVAAGTQTVRFVADTTPRDWGRLTGFGVLVILRPAAQGPGAFKPLAVARHVVPVQRKIRSSVDATAFASLHSAAKLALLKDIASAASDLQATEIVDVVRSALFDVDASVRLTAIEAIDGRTRASDLLAAPMRSDSSSALHGRREAPPAEWAADGDVFRAQLLPHLATVVRRDEVEQIRVAAVDAIQTMMERQRRSALEDHGVVTLFADVYRQDGSPLVRGRVVYVLASTTSPHPEVRAILRSAFADGDARVRSFAASALRAFHAGIDAHVRYAEVREEIAQGLVESNPAFRAAALAALVHVPQDARELMTVVQRIADSDSVEANRKLARRVLDLMN